ncbi:O-antigen ligase family protein [Paenibacillus glacialis]|nr:O-antigen ligase family protein [Paenibacillus glacialis]
MQNWEWKLSAVGLLVMGAFSCWQTGIFFASDMYPIVLGLSIVSLVIGFSLLTRSYRVWENATVFPDILVLLCPFLMMALYVLHVLSQPLFAQGTFVELLKWGGYGTFAVMAYYVGSKKEGRTLLQAGWHGIGLLLSLSAIFDIYGLVNIPHNIVYNSNPGISATGARLAGMIQYPNTFGALMAAFLLERLFALGPLMQQRPSTRRVLLGILPLAPYTAALLLSESRGGWLAAGVAVAAGLVLERRRLAPPLVLAAAPCLGTALLYRQLAHVQLAPVPWPSLLWLAGLWAGGMLAGLGLWRLYQSRHPTFSSKTHVSLHSDSQASFTNIHTHLRIRRLIAMLLVACIWTASFATIWFTVKERITANYGTVSARWIIYRDAWRLIQQAPWWGQGGYTWRMSYPTIQSQPYVGSEVHSGYLDILLNTGIVGFMILVFLLIGIGWILYKQYCVLVPPYLVLVLHAAVDFDWSFGLVWILIFWLAAWGFSRRDRIEQSTVTNVASLSAQHRSKKVISTIVCVLWLCTTMSLAGFALRGEMSSLLQRQALQTKDSEYSQKLLHSSLRWNPMNTDAALQLVRISSPEEGIRVLIQSLSYAPQHPGLVWKLANAYGELGESKPFTRWLSLSNVLDPYNTEKQSRSLEQLLTLSRDQMALGNTDESYRLIRLGVSQYNKYKHMVEQLSGQHAQLHNDRKFILTREAEEWGSQLDRLAQILPDS